MAKTIITPKGNTLIAQLQEVWNSRELLWMLAYKDIRVKYAQTFLGLTWALINPLITLALLGFVFYKIVQIDTGNTPFIPFTLVGLICWTYFSEVFSGAGESILGAQNLVKKVYFPRLIIPLSKTIPPLIDLSIVLLIFIVSILFFPFQLNWTAIFAPFFLLWILLIGLAGGIWVSALTIRYRDFRHIAPLFLRIGLFITPIAYPSSAVPEEYLFIFFLNPLACAIEGLRWSLLSSSIAFEYWNLGIMTTFLLLLGGIYYFNIVEKTVADIL